MNYVYMIVSILMLYSGVLSGVTGISVSTEIVPEEITDFVATVSTGMNRYACVPGHVSVTLPAQWRIIPEKEIESYKRTLKETLPGRPAPNYVIGMQRRALFTFALPYALVEIEKCRMPSLEEIQAVKLSYADTIYRAYLPLHRSGMFGEVNAMPAEYYPERGVVLGYSEMTRTRDNVRLAAITAMYPCRYGYLRIHFFVNTKDRDRDMQAVDEIISSVVFDKEFGYEQHTREYSTGNMRQILYGTIAVLACGWLFLRFVGRRIKKRAPFQR